MPLFLTSDESRLRWVRNTAVQFFRRASVLCSEFAHCFSGLVRGLLKDFWLSHIFLCVCVLEARVWCTVLSGIFAAACVLTVWEDIPCIYVQVMLLLLVLHSCKALHRHFFLHRNFLKEILCTRFPPEAAAVYKLIERKHSICIAKVAQLGKGNGRDHLVCAFMAFPPTYAQCSFLSCHLTLVCVLAAPKYT